MKDALEDFRRTIETAGARLRAVDEAESRRPKGTDKWSARQIIGHLIDSAANNHARFVLAQLKDDLLFPGYEQNAWVRIQQYQRASWLQLVDLWRAYNLHLLHVMSCVPKEKLANLCTQHSLP